MKKTITLLVLIACALGINSQTVADFENLTLGTDTFYENHGGAGWQTSNASFRYSWDSQFSFWDAGFAYTNKNNIADGSYHNMYAAITGKGYNNSDKYVTAWAGYGAEQTMIKLAPAEKSVSGFFITNSTYAYKTMLNGGGPARAFGDTLNTHSGMTPGDYPDWFKITVHAYKGGAVKTDTVEFYLADYRFEDNTKDYIVNTWQWLDCSRLGAVDSLFFTFYSSDEGAFGINTPTYFCMDNFTTTSSVITGISELSNDLKAEAYPNPFHAALTVSIQAQAVTLRIKDISGKTVHAEVLENGNAVLDLNFLHSGIYFLELFSGNQTTTKKIVKN